MGVSPNYPFAPPTMNHQQDHNNMNLSMVYYSFFIVATAGVLLAIYHCLVINWCAQRSWPSTSPTADATVQSHDSLRQKVMQLDSTTYKYTNCQKESGGNSADECVVCLSVFGEGEDIRKLLRCNHSFHTPCIDMWLHSHFDCPLCRAPVGDLKGMSPHPDSLTGGFVDASNSV